ncbi:MAG: macro domain-containing protein [Cyanobacteriota bacterium]|nr:macro domain-containing protein [Cyanobacteriota bacterium]
MIHPTSASVFNAPAEVITNTVNCEGVMGAGLALEMSLRHPELDRDYQERCQESRVEIGRPYLFPVQGCAYRAVLNFPTKKSWRFPSQLGWIDQGLAYLAANYARAQPPIRSLALPKLGCDKGGLDWDDVSALVHRHLGSMPDLHVYLCLDTAPAQGAESAMLEAFRTDQAARSLPAFLKGAALRALLAADVPSRFRQLAMISGVGKQSYQRLFQHYYQLQAAKPLGLAEPSQLSLLDSLPAHAQPPPISS